MIDRQKTESNSRGGISNWKPVLSGVPQRMVLVPISLFIFINDLEDYLASKVLKLTNDTILFRTVKTLADR